MSNSDDKQRQERLDDEIGKFLDRKGYGTMTGDMIRLFAAVGCKPPRCHAANCSIEEGDRFRIKPIAQADYADDDDRDTITMSLMVCMDCDKADTPIPRTAYEEMLRKAPIASLRDLKINIIAKVEAKPVPPRAWGGCFSFKTKSGVTFNG